ncbi:unnamed protein product [Anisakis simplex]|uniref:Polysaccharide biosynthesis protein n=1 Tax=Anisakis simplex TaxID=6269 RepID=A0A0M3K488_ANISI|nr:unnamed protein product [Anisakis simplex]
MKFIACDYNIVSRNIDLRILNWIYVLAGLIGMYCLPRNYGGVIAKTLYCVSIVIGIATAIFYGFTTYRVVEAYKAVKQLNNTQAMYALYGGDASTYVGKIVISAIMIAIPALAALISMIAAVLLDSIVCITQPMWSVQSEQQERIVRSSRLQLNSLSTVKLLLALGTLGLAFGGVGNYIRVATAEISAMLAVASAVVDVYSVASKQQATLNSKVAVALSIIAAVWCLKAVDVGMNPFYYNDLKFFKVTGQDKDQLLTPSSGPHYIIAVSEGVLLGCFCLLYLLCVLTAIQASRCVLSNYVSMNMKVSQGLIMQSRCFGLLHVFWAVCLMTLVVLGLLDLPWNGAYIGGDLLWMAVLFFSTGALGSTNLNVMATTRFVLSVVSLAVAVEKMCVSINDVYQAATYPSYANGAQQIYVGQIVLYAVQLGILTAEAITSLATSIIFGRIIALQYSQNAKNSSVISSLFSFGVLFYGIIFIGVYVLFELGKWRYSEVPAGIYFYRLGNGPVAIAVFIVQGSLGSETLEVGNSEETETRKWAMMRKHFKIATVYARQFWRNLSSNSQLMQMVDGCAKSNHLLQLCCLCFRRLLLAAAILQTIVGALALFAISYAMTNTYYLATMFSSSYAGYQGPYHETILIVSIILSGACTIACALCTFCAVIACLRATNILHHRATGSSLALVAPVDDTYDVQRTYATASTIPRQQPLMQLMEEQSVYWSTDENPYFYQTSKRSTTVVHIKLSMNFYALNHEKRNTNKMQNSSRFHGYALAHPHLNDSGNAAVENYRQRHLNSSSAQTRIGHVFD